MWGLKANQNKATKGRDTENRAVIAKAGEGAGGRETGQGGQPPVIKYVMGV